MPKTKKAPTVTVDTDLTINNISHLYEILSDSMENSKKLCVDLRHVSDCDSAGIQLLIALRKTALARQIDVCLSNTTQVVTGTFGKYGLKIDSLFEEI